MPIGFYDDPSFRWSPEAATNLAGAEKAHASVIHALVDWNSVAPTKPANALDAADYHLSDIDALVRTAQKDDMQVLLTITGTPSWANGGKTPNYPPTNLNTLTQFAQMLATRYNGKHAGLGVVTMFSVWNEPNLGLFLLPQFEGKTIVSPQIYVKLFNAAYKGIKAGNPSAIVAAGETSNQGRAVPASKPGNDAVAPGTFAEDVAKVDPKLPFAAWATHPYPSVYKLGPLQKVAFPNVGFSTLSQFGASLATWFHRAVPIWITEYGEQTIPQQVPAYGGVSYAQQARDAKKALQLAAANPYVHMFVWFIFRDSNAKTWFSGLETSNGVKKPAYSTFVATAAGIVGQTQVVRPNARFSVTVAVPFMAWHGAPGTAVGLTWAVKSTKGSVLAAGQAREKISAAEQITFPVAFDPVKGVAYTLTVTTNNSGGQRETHVVAIEPN
jgi:hypothetical protein